MTLRFVSAYMEIHSRDGKSFIRKNLKYDVQDPWQVWFDGKHVESYPTREDARAAIRAMKSA